MEIAREQAFPLAPPGSLLSEPEGSLAVSSPTLSAPLHRLAVLCPRGQARAGFRKEIVEQMPFKN